jgi:quinol monooxygenase YgiN
MDTFGIWSTFEAKPGKEQEVENFLDECRVGIERESGTTTFFALKIGPGRYATFGTMRDTAALEAHVNGPTADAVRARAATLFTGPPKIVRTTILTAKTAGFTHAPE